MTDKKIHDGEQDRVWDYFQNEGMDVFLQSKPRLSYIIREVVPGLKLLNIGVGGAVLEALALEKGIDVYSLDPSERTIENLRDHFDMGEKAQVGYSENIPFDDDMFDVVIMSEVLEHLNESEFNLSVKEVARVLKKKGVFTVTVPFEEDLSDNNTVCPHCGEKFHRWGHKQSFSISGLRKCLESNGFDVERIESRCFPDWSRKGMKNKIKLGLRYILGRFGSRIAQPNIYARARLR